MFAWGRISGSESSEPLGTTQKRPLRLSFGTGEPQFLQNQRGNPGFSEVSTNFAIKPSPRVHLTEFSGYAKLAACTEPVDFWQDRQWQ